MPLFKLSGTHMAVNDQKSVMRRTAGEAYRRGQMEAISFSLSETCILAGSQGGAYGYVPRFGRSVALATHRSPTKGAVPPADRCPLDGGRSLLSGASEETRDTGGGGPTV